MRCPAVSVIMSVYNTGRILRETIASVIAQTFADFELLIVDDGSTDEITQDILADQNDHRIRIIRQRNAGVAAARNRGIAEARGEYLAFLDHDDIFMPDKLAALKECLDKSPRTAVVYSPVVPFGECSAAALSLPPLRGECYSTLLRRNLIYSVSCIMVRTEFLSAHHVTFDPGCVPCDDWDFHLQCAVFGEMTMFDRPLVGYRMHRGNQSADRVSMYEAGIRTVKKHLRNVSAVSAVTGIPKRRIRAAGRYALAEHLYGLGRQDLAAGRRISALVHCIIAFTCDPMVFLSRCASFLRRRLSGSGIRS